MFVETSEGIDKVLSALVKAKSEIGKVAKGANNPFFKSKYADLPAILDVVEPALANNGLALLQPIADGVVISTFVHESGQFVSIEGQELVAAKQNDPQAMGSAITYARRYSLSSALSINADKDDDGEAAMKVARSPKNNKPAPSSPGKKSGPVKPTSAQFKAMVDALEDGKVDLVKSSLDKYSLTATQKKLLASKGLK